VKYGATFYGCHTALDTCCCGLWLKWFMLTLNSFKGFEHKMKKKNCEKKFGTKYYNI
jgi:hypothetical protein